MEIKHYRLLSALLREIDYDYWKEYENNPDLYLALEPIVTAWLETKESL